MLNKGFGGLAGLALTASIASFVGALQGSDTPAGSSGLWIATVVFFVVGVAAGIGWFLTRQHDDGSSAPSVKARADHQSKAFAAGRDIRIREFHEAPSQPATPPRPAPSFDLQHRPNSEGYVHLSLVNFADVGVFHVDVTQIDQAKETETTPYPVKWRGFAGEDRQVVREALIDLAVVEAPWYDDPNSMVVFVNLRRKVNNWSAGHFLLYSHSLQGGWDIEPNPVKGPEGMPEHVALFLEEVSLHVRAIRLDSGEEITRIVHIGFNPPTWNESTYRWDTSKDVRVQLK